MILRRWDTLPGSTRTDVLGLGTLPDLVAIHLNILIIRSGDVAQLVEYLPSKPKT